MRIFDTTCEFDHEAVTTALQLAVLAPNSSNLQTWEFYRIRKKESIQEMTPLCLNQNAARTASELVLFVTRRDLWKKRAQWHLDFIKYQMENNEGNSKRHYKGLRYYGKSIPFLYKTGWFGLFSLFRRIHLIGKDLRRKPFLRWIDRNDLRVVSHKSIALAAENFMLSMVDQGYDTCPMEGFDEKKVKQYLGLPGESEISMIVACGKGTEKGIYYESRRLPLEQVVFECN